MQAIVELITMTTSNEDNSSEIKALRQAVSDIVQRIILPMAERIDSHAERIDSHAERIEQTEASLEKASQVLTLVSGIAERNVRDIAHIEDVLAATAERIEAIGELVSQTAQRTEDTRELVSQMALRLEGTRELVSQTALRLEGTRDLVTQNADLFRLMLEENRADRSEWRGRLERLEQAA